MFLVYSVIVSDGSSKPFAWGFYNDSSMFRVRIMGKIQDGSLVDSLPDVDSVITEKIKEGAGFSPLLQHIVFFLFAIFIQNQYM